MAVWSCLNYKTIPTSCIEYVHPWTDSCRDAWIGLLLHSFKHSLRTYTTLYLFTALMRRKKPSKEFILQTIGAILQSTVFLTTHAYGFAVVLCTIRKFTGSFNVLSVSFTPAFLTSLVAIQLERASRRPILCLYVTNVATETLFRMAVDRGWVKPIPYGEVAIFTTSIACLLYRYRGEHAKDSIFSLLRYVVGAEEERECDYVPAEEERECDYVPEVAPSRPHLSRERAGTSSNQPVISLSMINNALRVYKDIVDKFKNLPKSPCCPHDNSCVHYVLKGGVKMLAVGYGVQVLLRTVLSVQKISRKPSLFFKNFFSSDVLDLAAFLGAFSATFKGVSCLLRWIRGKDSQMHAIPAGLLAGLSFNLYPGNTLALYVMWKALQILVWDDLNWHVPGGLNILYAFSTAILFHAALVEPQMLRMQYCTFLNEITGGRFVAMDRRHLQPFNRNSFQQLQNIMAYSDAIDAGYLPEIPFGTIILYSFSTAVLFHAAFLEPQNLRSNYVRFLDGLSGGRIVAMARAPLDHFGLDTSRNLAQVLAKLKINPNPRYKLRIFGNTYPKIS